MTDHNIYGKCIKFILTCISFLLVISINATELIIKKINDKFIPAFSAGGKIFLSPPAEGLWSVALDWQNDWPAGWIHASADSMERSGDWTVLHGKITLPEGEWVLRDAFRTEGNKIRCVRRFEWHSDEMTDKVTLSSRWQTQEYTDRIMMPGIIYYGNPSGYRNGKNMPTFGKETAPEAFFEEHRFPMPFAAVEIKNDNRYYSVALHTLPSPVPYNNIPDQWWSIGTKALDNSTEVSLLSGPVAWNNQRSTAKARQKIENAMKYGDTWLNVEPGAVIEKTFFIEISQIPDKGWGFIPTVNTSMDIFKPFFAEDMPSFEQIIHDKYQFAKSRYVENEDAAGFNMYPSETGNKFVFGWCGQAASPGYALQVLKPELNDSSVDSMVQKSLDKLSESPFNEKGFLLRYDLKEKKWEGQDPLSQGQGMYNFAKAIQTARSNKRFDTSRWELFLQKACDIHAKRILSESWDPLSTNEGFLVAPLAIAWQLFNKKEYLDAAKKAADHYMKRHLDMEEPYWGGTLDATGEDKEGAWAGLQAFLTMYETTGEEKYLAAAEHAAYILLSYTVVWDIPFPASRLANHFFKTRGWTTVSPQNMHIDVYGVLCAPSLCKLGNYLNRPSLKKIALLMFRSCGQMIDPYGSHGEQLQHTNFAQSGDMCNISNFRGGYAEHWTVFWITAHFLNAAAQFREINMSLMQ